MLLSQLSHLKQSYKGILVITFAFRFEIQRNCRQNSKRLVPTECPDMRQSSCTPLYSSSPSHEYLLHSTFSNAPMRLHIKLAAGRHLRKTSPKTSPSGRWRQNAIDMISLFGAAGWLHSRLNDLRSTPGVAPFRLLQLCPMSLECVHVPF